MILVSMLSWIKGMWNVRWMQWWWIIANRWPLLDRRDRRAIEMWQIRLKSWIRRNIENFDQVLESVSIWQNNASTLLSVWRKSWERQQNRPQPQRQNWRESRVASKDVSDVYWISLGWESWTMSPMWPWMQTGLETQRRGAPRLVECWQLARASLFDIGLWHRQQYRYPQSSQRPRRLRKVALKRCAWNTCWNTRLHDRSKIELWTDSSSAKAILQRLGPGRRAKHLEVQTMWVQQLNKIGLISLNKLNTLENVADLLTKNVPRAVLDKLAGMMGYIS